MDNLKLVGRSEINDIGMVNLNSEIMKALDIPEKANVNIWFNSENRSIVVDTVCIDETFTPIEKAKINQAGQLALSLLTMHSSDFIMFHPPYHYIITYSGKVWGKPHEDDLSRCENYNDFIEKLNFVIKKLFLSLRKDGRLAILVGDIRKNGQFHSIQQDMMKIGKLEAFITKGQFNCVSDNNSYSKPFIPVVTEYIVLLHKNNVMMIPFTHMTLGMFNPDKEDSKALTWKDLIRLTMEKMGGKAELGQLYGR